VTVIGFAREVRWRKNTIPAGAVVEAAHSLAAEFRSDFPGVVLDLTPRPVFTIYGIHRPIRYALFWVDRCPDCVDKKFTACHTCNDTRRVIWT
jgi:hypothetical protein